MAACGQIRRAIKVIARNAPIHQKRKYHRLYMRAWRRRNPSVGAEYMRKKREKNKEAMLRYERSLYKKNRDKFRKKGKIYRKNNKEYFATAARNRRTKLAKNGGVHTKEDIGNILSHQKWKCVYCLKCIRKKYHIDHKVPIARGGSNFSKNLQALCAPCNMKKNKKTHREFLREISYAT